MSMKISATPETANTSASAPVEAQKQEPQKIFKTKKMELSNEKREAADNLKTRVLKMLNLEDNFLQVSFYKKENGVIYLKLTRPADDKNRKEMRTKFSNGAIKEKLGLKDGVLKANNDLKDVTGRPNLEQSEGATIEPGKSLLIPLSELGQNFKWYHFGKNDIKNDVQNFLSK